MSTHRDTDSVKATSKGKKELIKAQRQKLNYEGAAYSYLEIMTEAASFQSEKTVSRFFKGEPVRYKNALAICEVLDLDIEDIVEQIEKESIRKYDWYKICSDKFADQQQKLRTRRGLLNPNPNLDYVPLGLVKPKSRQEKSKYSGFDSSRGMRQYEVPEEEIEKTFEHDTFLDEIVGQPSKSVVIVGEPGAGKSTWMEKIGDYLIQQPNSPPPIFISLSLLDRKLEDYLCGTWLDEALQLQKLLISDEIIKEFKGLLRSQYFCLLLDGLDEMRSEHPTRDLSNDLQGFLKNVRVFLSCRLNLWEASGRQYFFTFDVFRSLAFSDEQVTNFIKQWYGQNLDQGQKLINQLREDRANRLRDLIKNPLRLVMLCSVWDENQELPQTKAELYSEFVGFVYERERGRNKFNISILAEEKLNQALGELAKRMFDAEKVLDQSFVVQILNDQLELAEKLGWLNIIGKSKGKYIYAFYHLTFAEYFAAYAIREASFFFPLKRLDSSKYNFFNPKFREVFLFWMGMTESNQEKTELIRSICRFYTQNWKYFQYYKAAYSKGLIFDAYQELDPRYTENLGSDIYILSALTPSFYSKSINKYQFSRDFTEPEWLVKKLGVWMHQQGKCRIDFRPSEHENPYNVSFDFWTAIKRKNDFLFSLYEKNFDKIKEENKLSKEKVDEIISKDQSQLINYLFIIGNDLFLNGLVIQQLILIMGENTSKLDSTMNAMLQNRDSFNLQAHLSFNYVLIEIVKIHKIDLFACSHFKKYLEFCLNNSFIHFDILRTVSLLIYSLSLQNLQRPQLLSDVILRHLSLLSLDDNYRINKKMSFLKYFLEVSLANLCEDLSYVNFLQLWNITV
ncbi:hypothetical protein AWQ21_10835 [Picosynechococcus sp. PCC 7003]|uniref:NACHT domain-containing protein n=1 Tax=Picosynechococcus sp. PCC 7003 TaxID=374981 RepID=UPI00081084EC|nr:NACHT domain-containing protein [Picosynechococcus sp. PCC 7003]ANV84829.1 hypothetical protein AWQ21_10835 [Picosynechococcus sp. PCC 7003]